MDGWIWVAIIYDRVSLICIQICVATFYISPRYTYCNFNYNFNHYQDKQDAEAALQELSYALPSPPPPNEFPLVLEKEGKRFHGGGDTAVRIQKPIETTSNDDSEVLARQEEEGQYHTTTNIKDDVNEDDKADELESK